MPLLLLTQSFLSVSDCEIGFDVSTGGTSEADQVNRIVCSPDAESDALHRCRLPVPYRSSTLPQVARQSSCKPPSRALPLLGRSCSTTSRSPTVTLPSAPRVAMSSLQEERRPSAVGARATSGLARAVRTRSRKATSLHQRRLAAS